MKVFNNLTNKLEDFKNLKEDLVHIYSCGPTVYDDSHIGHARSAITWDLLARYLRYKGYKVNWIRNITNVDDKIINRAKELNISPDTLSRKYTYEFWADMSALNVSWPDFEPRATDYIDEMIEFIQGLMDKGAAYEVEGDVYFRIKCHKDYGQLKKQSIEQLKEGHGRIEENSKKEDQLDFALWKAFPDDKETSFKSPWGYGRPGWHLECSTMIKSILEKHDMNTLDIHSGGDDLIFPHHENECAQSECLTGEALAKYWMHNGMVMVNGTKMSKSLNNYMTIKDTLAKFSPNTIRYFCLATHYKRQINFTNEALQSAENGFKKLLNSLSQRLQYIKEEAVNLEASEIEKQFKDSLDQSLIKEFEKFMDNDLSSPQALALLFEKSQDEKSKDTIIYLLSILGFNLETQTSSNTQKLEAMDAIVSQLLEIREQARANKDFATSDKIRDQLQAAGISIKDYRDKASEWSFSDV
ncbi:MAG: cysteine--tRNA ligase [Candidatus Caenarcaniphilales bacterium]|nr:cysteine--tRNA ligase [Candidatus Caenarcaniphilales bacterium]